MKDLNVEKLKIFLDGKANQYNRPEFIANDPVCIPHGFTKKQDIEIMGFFAATLAWGQRTTIISNCKKLVEAMDNSPHEFITGHTDNDLAPFEGFVHRTFNDTDLLYFLSFLQFYYRQNTSMEDLFSSVLTSESTDVGEGLVNFHKTFFSLDYAPQRTRKHVATPDRKSACKRLNMFLRWMVRKDEAGVDFGIWNSIRMDQLICPLDTHVHRVATGLGLLGRKQSDWQAAQELTAVLRQLDPSDPVKYDYALFGLGIEERF